MDNKLANNLFKDDCLLRYVAATLANKILQGFLPYGQHLSNCMSYILQGITPMGRSFHIICNIFCNRFFIGALFVTLDVPLAATYDPTLLYS